MDKINWRSDRGASILARYVASKATSLSDVYGRYSDKKRKAWEDCKSLCNEMGGKNLRIIGHNVDYFSAGFEVFGGEYAHWLCYITKTGTYCIEIVP